MPDRTSVPHPSAWRRAARAIGLISLVGVPLILVMVTWLLPAWLDDGFLSNDWKTVTHEHVVQHPSLAALAPHIAIEDAVRTGFQDKRYLMRFRFKDGRSMDDAMKTVLALPDAPAAVKDGARTLQIFSGADQNIPAWWQLPGAGFIDAYMSGTPPATAVLTLIPIAEQNHFLAMITEY